MVVVFRILDEYGVRWQDVSPCWHSSHSAVHRESSAKLHPSPIVQAILDDLSGIYLVIFTLWCGCLPVGSSKDTGKSLPFNSPNTNPHKQGWIQFVQRHLSHR